MRMHEKDINISDRLLRLKTFDRIGRRNIIIQLERFIRNQSTLESVCLEGLSLTPAEGLRLVLALYNSRKTIKSVYCWRAFEKTKSPSQKIKKSDWFRAIGCLEYLTTLSVNYAYIATPTGDLLINLSKKLGENWHWLQLLCLNEDSPSLEDTDDDGTVEIPDAAWREVHFWAPTLKIQYAIIEVPEYDRHKRFFTKNTPVHTFALSSNIDLRYRESRYIDCTIKTLCSWYSHSLVYLCLQFWHQRENLDCHLRRLFLNLPLLKTFEFIGEIRMLKTLCTMCCQIRSGKCNIQCVKIQLQNIIHSQVEKSHWEKSVECLIICFKHDFDKMNVKFNVSFYLC